MKKIALFLLFTAILLSSCFIPDNYEAEVWVHKDGSYEFFFKGDLAYAPALELVRDGEFDIEDLDDMLKIADDLNGVEGVMEAEHLGKGRFRVEVIMPLKPGEDYNFLSDEVAIFSFKHNEDGNLVIRGLALEDDDLASLKSFGIDMNGELLVKTDKGVKVASHNAMLKKKDKKTGTTYLWDLDIDARVPEMIIKQ